MAARNSSPSQLDAKWRLLDSTWSKQGVCCLDTQPNRAVMVLPLTLATDRSRNWAESPHLKRGCTLQIHAASSPVFKNVSGFEFRKIGHVLFCLPHPHHLLVLHELKAFILFLWVLLHPKHPKIAGKLLRFRQTGNFKIQKPSKPLASFQSEWKTVLKQNELKWHDIYLA